MCSTFSFRCTMLRANHLTDFSYYARLLARKRKTYPWMHFSLCNFKTVIIVIASVVFDSIFLLSHALSSWMKLMPSVAEDLARAQSQIMRFRGH
jgi:hypothetical protein